MENNQIPITEDQIFACIGRLTMENQILRQQIAVLQQQIAQSQVMTANGKTPEESTEIAKPVKA